MPIAPYPMIPETPDGRNRNFAAPPGNKDRQLRSSCSASSWHPPFPLGWRFAAVRAGQSRV